MSSIEVYSIAPAGAVRWFADVRNSHGYAPFIWDKLCTRLGYASYREGVPLLWQRVNDPALGEFERIVLASTFDNVWFRRSHLKLLIVSLSEFMYHHDAHATMAGVCVALTEIRLNWKATGACFNGTSVNPNPWRIRTGFDKSGYARYRAFNVKKDTVPHEFFPEHGPRPACEIADVVKIAKW